MSAQMEHVASVNENPLIIVNMDGTVLHSNEASESLLHEWCNGFGDKLTSNIGEIIQRVISRNSPEKLDVKVGNKIYLVVFSPLPEQNFVNISGFDISEKKDPEERLMESEEKYRNIVETTSEGIWVIDAENRTTYVNKKMAEILGYSPQEMIGRLGMSFVDEEKTVHYQMMLDNRKKGINEVHENKLVRKDGSKIWVLTSSKSIFNKEGKFSGVLSMLTDITEHKRTKDSLKISEKHLNELLNSIQDGFFELDKDWRFTFINQRAANSGNFEPEQLIGECIWEKLPYLINSKFEKTYKEVMETRKPAHFEIKSSIMDQWYDESVYPSESGISVFWRDATDRKRTEELLKRSEKNFRSIFERSTIGIIVGDLEGRVTQSNPAAEHMLGYEKEELRNKFFQDFTVQDDLNIETPLILELMDGKRDHYEIEKRYIRKDGQIIWVRFIGTFFIGSNNNPYGLALLEDITQRKNAEEALKKSEEKYRLLYENMLDGFVIVGMDGFIREYNNAYREMLGYSDAELRHLTYPDITPEKWHALEARILEEEILNKGYSRIYEKEYRRKDGSIISIELRTHLIRDASGQPAGMWTITRDVTERKQLEEHIRQRAEELETVMELAPVAIWIGHDPQSHYITGNRMANKFYEAEAGENVSANVTPVRRFFHKGRELTADELLMQQASLYDLDIRNVEYDVFLPDGKWISLLGSASPMYNGDGSVRGSVGTFLDISERKKAEKALKEAYDNLEEKVKERTAELENAYELLKESERGLTEAQEIAHLGNWYHDFVNNKLYWSDEMYRIFGLKPEEIELSYDIFLSYVHPEDRDYVENAVKKAVVGKTLDIEYRIILTNGLERVIYSKTRVILDKSNNNIKFLGTVLDITERKRAEEQIQNLANIVESSNEAIGTMSLDGIVITWNKGAENIYGYSAEEVLGKPVSILAPSHLQEEMKKLANLFSRGEGIRNYETSRVRKDGKSIDVSLNLSPVFDAYGKMTAVSIIARDITEIRRASEKLKESEEKYRSIVETANEGIVVCDSNFKVTYVNNKMTDMLGYQQEELIGKTALDFIDEEGKNAVKLKRDSVSWQRITDIFELKLIRTDGSSLWTLVNSKLNFDMEGNFTGSLNMLTDITERKNAAETLANYELSRKKEMHHRIKNNLQVISSLLDLQADKFKCKKTTEVLEVLQAFRESQDRVLSMALIHEELHSNGGMSTINISQYIDELADNLFLTYRLGNENTGFNKIIEPGIFFDMDTTVPLGLIINELISNSFKYAFAGRDNGEIQVKLYRENGECITEGNKSTNYVLSVSDNGVGIPADLDIENLDSLGLQLVTTLVEQLDGELELKRNNGTEFVIRFLVAEN